jgi:CRISPR system Cascade subunit CasA
MRNSSAPLLHNLLDEPLLGVEDDQGRRKKLTLPGLLARLSHGRPTALTAVQAHQQHPVHAFLVQLAAIALARAGTSELAHDEAAWRALLLGAAGEDGAGVEAFTLA